MDDPKTLLQKLSPILALTAGLMFCLAAYLRYLGSGEFPIWTLLIALGWFLFAALQYVLFVKRE